MQECSTANSEETFLECEETFLPWEETFLKREGTFLPWEETSVVQGGSSEVSECYFRCCGGTV